VCDHEPVLAGGSVKVARVLGEPLRWRIVQLVTDEQLCVRHLTDELSAPQPLVSHHLRVLQEAGLVTSERLGSCVYYRATPEGLEGLIADLQGLARRPSREATGRRPC
jgi:ArsR family transcriptional regulator